jgi:regulator of PEP synthase PpsR (kinase-PPPase family)
VEAIKHFWPMVRSEEHLERILGEISTNPGLVLFTLVNPELRRKLEHRCRALGLPYVARSIARPMRCRTYWGRRRATGQGASMLLDEAYFARISAIQYTIAHDDGVGPENWEDADIVLVGVSRTSKTPTSIYLANRGYKTANVPLVPESPPPEELYGFKHPMVVGLTINPSGWCRCAATGCCRSIRRRRPIMSISIACRKRWRSPGA